MEKVRARIGGHEVGDGCPLLLIAGPCVIESEAQALSHARRVKDLARRHGLKLATLDGTLLAKPWAAGVAENPLLQLVKS